jgi:hypothetical protein
MAELTTVVKWPMFLAIPLALVVFPLASRLSDFLKGSFNLTGQLQTISHSLIVGLSVAAVFGFAMHWLVFRRWQAK